MADLALQSTTQSTIPPGYQLDIQPTPTQTAASLNRVVIDIQGGRNVINDNLNEVGGQFDLGGGTGVREFMAPAQRRVATTSVWGGNGQCRQLQTSTGELPSLALQKVATFCMNAYPSDSGDDDSSGAPSVAPVAVGWAVKAVAAIAAVSLPSDQEVISEWVEGQVGDMEKSKLLVLGIMLSVPYPALQAAGRIVEETDEERAAAALGETLLMRIHVVEAVQKAEDLAAQQSSPPPLSASAGGASAASDGRQHHSFKDEVQMSKAAATCSTAVASMRPKGKKLLPKARRWLQEQGLVANPVLDLEEVARYLPGAVLRLSKDVDKQTMAAALILAAIQEAEDPDMRDRAQDAMDCLDSRFTELLVEGIVTVVLTPLEAATGIIPEAQVRLAVLNQPTVALQGAEPPEVRRLLKVAAAVDFVSPSGSSIVLGPGVAMLKAATQDLEEIADGDALRHVPIKKVCESVARALGVAIVDQRRDLDNAGGSFRAKAADFIRVFRQFIIADPMAQVPMAMFEGLLAWLSIMARHQQQDEADLDAISGEGSEVRAQTAQILRLQITQKASEEEGGVSVSALSLAACDLTSGCIGRHRRSDPLCGECRKWKDGWVCMGCGYVTLSHLPECHDYKCDGQRPTLPLSQSSKPGPAQEEAQLRAYSKRSAAEARSASRSSRF